MRSRYVNTLKCMLGCLSFVASLVLVAIAAPEDAAFVPRGRRPPECYDRDSYTPLCTNQFGSYCCHWENVRNKLRWQRDVLKKGLANYDRGDAGTLMETTYYLSAYARKLERRGLGYEAATNAYCALSWLHRSALRGCEEARLACGCCLSSGGARGHHSLHIWSGPASCYSQDLHDVPAQAMAYFEPAPEYLLDDKDGVRRYVRAYDQSMEMSREYLSLVDSQRRSWHESFTGRADRPASCGWNQSTGSVEVVRIDFSGYDVRRHVERLVSDMDADIREAERRMKLDHERERRESEERLRERAREVNRRNATSPAAPL